MSGAKVGTIWHQHPKPAVMVDQHFMAYDRDCDYELCL